MKPTHRPVDAAYEGGRNARRRNLPKSPRLSAETADGRPMPGWIRTLHAAWRDGWEQQDEELEGRG